MKNNPLKLQNRIKVIRSASGYSQIDVVEYIKRKYGMELTYNWIGRIEREEVKLTQDSLVILSKMFNISTDYILRLSNDPRTSKAMNMDYKTQKCEQDKNKPDSLNFVSKRNLKDSIEASMLRDYWDYYGLPPIAKMLGKKERRNKAYYENP